MQSVCGPVVATGIVMSQQRCCSTCTVEFMSDELVRCEKTEGHGGNHQYHRDHGGYLLVWGADESGVDRARYEALDS